MSNTVQNVFTGLIPSFCHGDYFNIDRKKVQYVETNFVNNFCFVKRRWGHHSRTSACFSLKKVYNSKTKVATDGREAFVWSLCGL